MNFLRGVLSLGVTHDFQGYLFIHALFPHLVPILYDNDEVGVQPKLVAQDSTDPPTVYCLTSRRQLFNHSLTALQLLADGSSITR